MPRSGSDSRSNRKRTAQFSDTPYKRLITRQPTYNEQNMFGPSLSTSRQHRGPKPSGTGQRQSRGHQDSSADEPPLACPARSLLKTLSNSRFPVSNEAMKLRDVLNTHIIPGKRYTEGIRRLLETPLPIPPTSEDRESVESANRQLGGIALLYGFPLSMFARPERDVPAADPLEWRKQAILAEALSPAPAATIKWLTSEQTNYPMGIGRVVATVGCTISVYHPVFSQFKTHMENAELIPTPDQARNAHKLLAIGQTVYATEYDRLAKLYPILSSLLRPVEGPPSYLGFEPDGLIFVRTQNDVIPILVLETKNEIGTGGCDPEVQCAFSYQRLWSHDTFLSKVRNACCCPSFLLSMAGHKITIHGAVLAEGFITQPLTEGIGTAGYSDNDAQAEKVAKYFAALQKCLQTLSDYYMSLKPRDDCELASFSPEFRKYGENGQFNLTYTSANLLPGRNGRAMFNALLKGPGISGRVDVKVKFTTRYCPEAHELLAKKGLAPKLRHWESFSGKWKVVVMDSLPGDNMATMPQQPIPERALKDLKDALTLLHSKDWVYGDLRRPNIITCTRDGAVEPGAMLVDFDWAGKHGKQTYPLGLSEHVKWPNGVRGGERMKKEHDIAMFDMLCMNKM